MSPDRPTARYVYTAADLMDLAHSPLVAPPASMRMLTNEELEGRRQQLAAFERPTQTPQWRKPRTYSASHDHVEGSSRWSERRGKAHRTEVLEEDSQEAISWLDPDVNDPTASGLGRVDDGVAEFEKWKQRKRGAQPGAPAEEARPPSNKASAQEASQSVLAELWESDIKLPAESAQSSRFSTFFKPEGEIQSQPTSGTGSPVVGTRPGGGAPPPGNLISQSLLNTGKPIREQSVQSLTPKTSTPSQTPQPSQPAQPHLHQSQPPNQDTQAPTPTYPYRPMPSYPSVYPTDPGMLDHGAQINQGYHPGYAPGMQPGYPAAPPGFEQHAAGTMAAPGMFYYGMPMPPYGGMMMQPPPGMLPPGMPPPPGIAQPSQSRSGNPGMSQGPYGAQLPAPTPGQNVAGPPPGFMPRGAGQQ